MAAPSKKARQINQLKQNKQIISQTAVSITTRRLITADLILNKARHSQTTNPQLHRTQQRAAVATPPSE
jgi:hypothetical protein